MRSTPVKLGVAAAVVGFAAWAYIAFDLGHWLTLDGLQEGLAGLHTARDANPVTFSASYFGAYTLATALSFPGAAVMTVAAGALFDLWWGTLIVSFASVVGATLAMLAARYVARDWVQARFGDKLRAINDGVDRDGPFYLLTLRLVPVFPFFLINIAMGLTRMRVWTFFWVSQIGMLPGTFVYVNAGRELASLRSLADVASPSLWLSFAALAALPWIGKLIVSLVKRRRVYAGHRKPSSFDTNLVVIGAGSAGLVSAYIAATVKAKVTLVEAGEMGGDCLNYGCVPSKALIKSAKVAHTMRHADEYGLAATMPQFSFRRVMARVHDVIANIAPHDSVERYEVLGVDVVRGWATIVDPWTVEVAVAGGGTRRITTRSIIIAAGAAPVIPPLPGIDDVGALTSDTLWEALRERDEPPARLVVLGGGPIGCELAQAFSRLGSAVTVVEMAESILATEDADVSDAARAALEADGVRVLTSAKAVRCGVEDGTKFLIAERGGEEVRLEFDELLSAVGRRARLTGYGLETLGVDTDRTVTTNEYLETLYPNVFAAGDVAGPYQFTHTAAHMAWFATVNALFGSVKKFAVDYRVIPRATFLDPQIARVGLSEKEATEAGVAYEVTRYGIDDLDRAITESAARGFVKVLTKPGKDTVLGVTIVGENAAELLAEYTLALKHKLGLNKILGTIHTYPTWSEANKYAAGEWKKAHAPQRALRLAERFHRWRRGGGSAPGRSPADDTAPVTVSR